MAKVRSGEQLRAYRESYNYRAEYFKRNPGLFGKIWFCSQCGRPLFGKKQVVIDHIIPLAKGGRNHVSNCTAICKKCNLSKSDKIDGRVVKGKIFKFFESKFSLMNRGAGATVGLTMGVTTGLARTLFKGAFSVVGGVVGITAKVITFPIRKSKGTGKLMFIVIYAMLIFFLLAKFTPLLDAWL